MFWLKALQIITQWNRILPENLTVTQVVKFSIFYGTRRFITMFIGHHPELVDSSQHPHTLLI
jgi:hypothetical protein